MRNLSFKGCKWDKKYFIAALIAFLCSVICGIVLYIFVNVNVYFHRYAQDYVYFVFNFKNSKLILSHLLSSLLYVYIFFLVAYFSKFKYITIALIFVRGLFFAIYTGILIGLNAFGGITVAVIVFIPSTLVSLLLCCITAETCKNFNKKYAFILPLILALIDMIIMLLLVNVVFRVIIVIV